MSARSLTSLRLAASLSAILAVSACDGDRPVPLSGVETVDVPPASTGQQANQNISNPTLTMPTTFEVADGDELTLVWSEEFDGPNIDPEVWFFATGDGTEVGLPGGWGNNELQYYLPDNAMIVNGVLEITARRETVGDLGYTSARINTEDRFAFQYGRIEASIKMPSGQGLWPAFWMLSQDSDYLCNGDPCIWAAVGEIDIVEAVNLDGTGGNEIFGTLHYGGEFPANQSTETRYTPSVDITEDFYTYAIEWDEGEIRWYFDGQLYAMQNSWFSSADNEPFPAPFNQPFHILLNLAVGGNFPGSPNGTTPLPATMEVDWVRVYSGEDPASQGGTGGTGGTGDHGADTASVFTETTTAAAITVSSITNSIDFGGNNTIADPASTAVTPFEGSVVLSIDYQDSGSTYGGAVLNFGGVDLTGYDTLNFTIDTSGLSGFTDLTLQIEPPGAGAAGTNVLLSAYTPVATSGNWATYAIPLADYTATDFAAAANLGFWNPVGSGGLVFGTMYVDDVYFSLESGGSSGGTGDHGADTASVFTETTTAAAITVSSITNSIDFGGNNTVADPSSTAVTPFEGSVVLAIDYQDSGSTYGGAVLNFGGVDLTGYDTLNFTIDTSGLSGFTDLTLQIEPPGAGAAGTNVMLSAYTPVATSGNWATYAIPLADYTATDFAAAANLGFWNPVGSGGLVFGTAYVDDVYFSLEGGGGSSGGGGEIAVNGGFEAGDLSDWTLFPVSSDPNEQAVVTTNPKTGTYAGRLNNTTPGSASIIKQANLMPVAIGDTATVSFSARGSFGVGGVAFAEFFTELGGGGASSAQILGGGPLALDADPNVWSDFNFVIPISADVSGGVTLQLTSTTGGDAASFADVYYDDISIVIN